ncbi:MAG: rhodanese-like domain-containing protein [Betaproteobacteria bacterium]|nr:rhodanese-like domain-containing protein [Betaproteobacteria bacterium]
MKLLVIVNSVAALSIALFFHTPEVLAQSAAVQSREGWYRHIVEFDFVKPHADLPKDDKAALLVDSRPAARRYDIGHIPTAINIPETQFDKHVDRLPADRGALVIFYCQGFECDLSHKSAFKAEALGYTNVKVYAGGQPDWEAKGELVAISQAHLRKLIDDKADFMLIDSRPERTFEKGTIPGAVNISDGKFDKMTDKLPADRNKMLVFFCGGLKCDLSSKSAVKARALGYRNVFVYPEGHPAWLAAMGVGATPGAAAPAPGAAPVAAASAIEPGKEKGSISVASFERILRENPSQIAIIDVRDDKDVKKGTFPGAANIPINDLEKKLASLPKDKPIVFTCSTGARSGEAYDTVKLLDGKIQAYFLDADVSFADGRYTIRGR